MLTEMQQISLKEALLRKLSDLTNKPIDDCEFVVCSLEIKGHFSTEGICSVFSGQFCFVAEDIIEGAVTHSWALSELSDIQQKEDMLGATIVFSAPQGEVRLHHFSQSATERMHTALSDLISNPPIESPAKQDTPPMSSVAHEDTMPLKQPLTTSAEKEIKTVIKKEEPPLPPTSGLAVIALVLGILSFAGCCLFTSIPAWIVGSLAIKEIDQSQGKKQGRQVAVVGRWMGIIATILSVIYLLIVIGAYVIEIF